MGSMQTIFLILTYAVDRDRTEGDRIRNFIRYFSPICTNLLGDCFLKTRLNMDTTDFTEYHGKNCNNGLLSMVSVKAVYKNSDHH